MSSTTRQGNGHERPDLIRGMVGRQVEQRESGERVSIMAQHLAGSVIELDEAVGLGVDQDDTVARLADDRRIDILAFAQCLECLVLTSRAMPSTPMSLPWAVFISVLMVSNRPRCLSNH